MKIKRNRRKLIIFDGDDTLWQTQELYDLKKKQFKKLMESQSFNDDNVIELMDQLDAKRVEILKFSKERFLESMLIVYAILCGRYNKKWDISAELKIRKLVSFNFVYRKLYKDAIKVIKMLSKYFDIVLVTAGEKETQREIIKGFGREFESYFLKIFFPEIKTVQEFKRIFDELRVEPKDVWVVGDSIKSDINPALVLGANVILILRQTWKYNEERLFNEKVNTVTSLTGVAKIILNEGKIGGVLL